MSRRIVRFLACFFALFLSLPSFVSGQQQTSAAPEVNVLEEVIVTGTRVRRSNLDSPSPVLVISAQALAADGITTLGEFSRYLPQNADTFSDSQSGGSNLRGAAGFNLRGIGYGGTLTLVNGRRVAPFGSSADFAPFVDINAIPVAAIERIEVLKDGASAIYGSEAVAGVVNIILKQNLDGFVAEAGYLTTGDGDGDEMDANIVGGWSSDTTRLVGSLSWFDRELIWSRDRDFSREADLSSVGGFNSRSLRSSPPTVRVLGNPPRIVADPACPEQSDLANRAITIAPNGAVQETCRFNFAAFTTLQQPSERWSATASLEHDFSDSITAFGEFIYSYNETQSILAPTPLVNYQVPANHPNNPFGQNVALQYRLLDAGDRGFDSSATTWRGVAGLRGGWDVWEWEGAVTRSEAESETVRFNGVLGARFQAALRGLGGSDGQQYYNPFGLNPQNSRDVLDQILISGTGTLLTSTETSADAAVNGHFGELPGGPIGAAFGAQWREIGLQQVADPEELSGVIEGGLGILPIIKDRRVQSAFVEFVLPVLQSLEAQLALRYDDYNDFGSTTNPKIGLGWRPREDFLLRATWGTSFRPPTFRELFDPVFESEAAILQDPWRCPKTGSFEDCQVHIVPSLSSGNPELQPDEGETRLLGFAWEPRTLDGFALSAELWEIEHRNRILSISNFSVVFDEFLFGVDPAENPLVLREQPTAEDVALGIPGSISSVRATYLNADRVTTRGLDLAFTQLWVLGKAGDLRFNLDYSYLDSYETGISAYGLEIREDWAGGYGDFSALPEHRGNLSLNWNYQQHGVNALWRYVSSYESPLNLVLNEAETPTAYKIGAYAQLDLQYNFTFSSLREAVLRLGCQNCSDEAPPVYNYNVVAEPFHEARGMLLYARWMQPF